MNTRISIIFILTFTILSCSTHQINNNDGESNMRFIKYMEVNNLLPKGRNKPNNIYMFISVDGCENCLKKSIEFMKNHPIENQYIIMDTMVFDVERFKKKFGLINRSDINVFYDSKNVLASGVYSENPYIIEIDWDEKILKRISLNPSSIDEELSKID